MFKVKNKNTKTTLMTSSGVAIIKFKHISHLFLVFLFADSEQVNVNWLHV